MYNNILRRLWLPPNSHGTHPFVLCREVVFFWRLFRTLNLDCPGLSSFGVSFIGDSIVYMLRWISIWTSLHDNLLYMIT